MTTAWGVLSALLLQQGVVLSDPPCEFAFPLNYARTGVGAIERRVSAEDWTVLRLTYGSADRTLAQPSGPLTLADVVPLAQLPKGSLPAFSTKPWREFQVGILSVRRVVGTLPVLTVQAVVPIHPKAVFVTIEGAEALEKEIRADLDLILSSFKGRCAWKTPEEIGRAKLADRLDLAGGALAALYLPAWAIFFRRHFMMAHWVRVLWLAGAAIVLLVPALLRSDFGVLQLALNLALPLALLGFAGRRMKLAVDLD